MINPLALGIMALGIILLLCGLVLIAKRKTAGILLSAVGLGALATPWLISLYLSARP
jgi:predicted metal-binding membrane protein